nr:GNAT family N-acetyltransferase [uncultured Cohaesibacter sp.]
MSSPNLHPSVVLSVRPLVAADADTMLRIYQEGIDTGMATFTDAAPTWEAWDKGHLPECRMVAVMNGEIAGWVALSAYSGRSVYRGVAEMSIYIANSAKGAGVGSFLMEKLIEASEANGFWTLQAGIFANNAVSIHLHEKFGFKLVGIRERIAQISYGANKGQWRDVALYERRSPRVGL